MFKFFEPVTICDRFNKFYLVELANLFSNKQKYKLFFNSELTSVKLFSTVNNKRNGQPLSIVRFSKVVF